MPDYENKEVALATLQEKKWRNNYTQMTVKNTLADIIFYRKTKYSSAVQDPKTGLWESKIARNLKWNEEGKLWEYQERNQEGEMGYTGIFINTDTNITILPANLHTPPFELNC